MKPKTKRITLGAVLALVIVGYALLLWRGPWWIDGAHLRQKNLQPADGVVITGFRTMLVAIGAGALAALGLYYTHKSHRHTEKLFEHTREKDREQAEVAREGQVTERYVEAIKLLSSGSLTQRLGGIYSLERIMRDSEKDHATIVEVLAAFIRDSAPEIPVAPDGSSPNEARSSPEEDVQAALAVLGRRPECIEEEARLNLSRTNLRGADLLEARLAGANLADSSLEGASLFGADLRGAYLDGVRLDQADLSEARLDEVDLSGASVGRAIVLGAILTSATVGHADFSQTIHLTREQLLSAKFNSSTKLPPRLMHDPVVGARIAEIEQGMRQRHPSGSGGE
ncbi:pentapeptide repeat-containing protein [Streptomyces sp. NPDC057424]|uniref:pentapeptide repeat-containing protein n=1 Tax=Streptomyces sp. NPDC057424 TaxID=3346127 RepID=UPI0036A44226